MASLKSGIFLAILLVFLSKAPRAAETSRILTVAPFFGQSHTKFIQAVTLHLAKQGHDVTIITSNLVKEPPPNYHQIPVTLDNYIKIAADFNHWETKNYSFIHQLFLSWSHSIMIENEILGCQTMTDFIKNDQSHFDVVMVEMFNQEAMYMFAHKYKAPLVLIDTTFAKRHVEETMGNPMPASYVPFEYFDAAGDFSIVKRFYNWFIGSVDYIGRTFHVSGKHNALARKYFDNIPEPLPRVEDLQNSASLVLVNTHFSIDTVFPQVPGIIQIGGAHIEEVKPLPKKVQKFLDGAEDGVIFFSLGSFLRSSTMPKDKIQAFLNVFKTLKQRVVWKWEDDEPPKQDNLLTGKWLPQNDILAHPNVKAFITHGGMLSIQEAVDKGVPIIGIPIFADQYLNIARLIERGSAIELDFLTINENTVRHALDQVFNVTSYQQMAQELSIRFNDRQNTPLDSATYWIEYVIKHKGAPFLKSPLAHLAWYKKYMIDVILIAAALLGVIIGAIFYLRHLKHSKEYKRLTKVILNQKFKKSL